MSSETFTRLFKECDPPAPSIMEGFLLCNGDETLAIVNPLVTQLPSQRLIGMVCTRNPGIMEGAGGQYPEKTAHILKKVFLLHRPLVIDMKMFYY